MFKHSKMTVALAALATTAVVWASGPSASAATPNTSGGLVLKSQIAYADGSVKVLYRDAAGNQYAYAGAPGAKLTLGPDITQTVNGEVVHSRAISVALTSMPSGITTLASAYTTARARALAVGTPEKVAENMYPSQSPVSNGVQPAVSNGQIVNSWCVGELHNGSAWDTGCDVRTIVGASGNNWYWLDHMDSSAQNPGGVFGLINDHIWMTYPSDDQVVQWVPNSSQSTNCQNDSITIGASAFGASLSETSNNTICNGHEDPGVNTNFGGSFGVSWTLNNNHSQHSVIGIEPIAEVHAPTADQGSVLHLTFAVA